MNEYPMSPWWIILLLIGMALLVVFLVLLVFGALDEDDGDKKP